MIFTIWILIAITSATCMMCTENTANMACFPCGHMLACENCQIPRGSSCPVCRNIVTETIKISRTGGSIFQNPTQAVQTENMAISVGTQTESVVQSLSETSTSAEVASIIRELGGDSGKQSSFLGRIVCMFRASDDDTQTFEEIAKIFIAHGISGALICDLTQDDLQQAGVRSTLQQRAIIRRLNSLFVTDTAKYWFLFRGGNQWKMTVFKNTSQSDLENSIRQLVGIEGAFALQDENGDSISLSASIASGTKLYVYQTAPPTRLFSYQWKWDQNKAHRHMTFSADGMTVTNKSPRASTATGGYHEVGFCHTFGDTQLAHGAAWSIHFEKWNCYVTTFVTDGRVTGHYGDCLNYSHHYKTLIGGRGIAHGNHDVNIELIHYLDLLNRKLIIINKECPSQRIHVTDIPSEVYPMIAFKASTATITGQGSEVLEGIDLDATPTTIITYLKPRKEESSSSS